MVLPWLSDYGEDKNKTIIVLYNKILSLLLLYRIWTFSFFKNRKKVEQVG